MRQRNYQSVFGYVENTGRQTVQDLVVEGEFLNSAGKSIGKFRASEQTRWLLPPGERSPFRYAIAEKLPKYSTIKFRVKVRPYRANAQCRESRLALALALGLALEPGRTVQPPDAPRQPYMVLGKVRNVSDDTRTMIRIYGIAYDRDGKLVSVAYTGIGLSPTDETQLEPGETGAYRLLFGDYPRQVSSYQLYVDGARYC